MSTAKFGIKISGDASGGVAAISLTKKELKGLAQKSGGYSRSIQKGLDGAKVAMTGFALASAGAGAAVIASSIKQENAIRQLEARIKSTGGVAGKTSGDLQTMASSLQKLTTYGDESIIEMQSLLLTFTNIRGEIFDKANPAILDMSVAMGTDLKTSALQLGKALNDPVAGISALSRSGIQFTQDQKDVIKSLVESGDTAKAQTIILKELETQFGGSAKAAADTFGGSLTQLGNAFGDLLEAPGGLNDNKEAIQDLTAILQDPETVRLAGQLTTALINGFTGAATAIRDTIGTVQFLAEEFAAITVGISSDDIVRLEENAKEIRGLLAADNLIEKGNRLRFFGPDGFIEYYNDSELQGKLDEVEGAIQAHYDSLSNRPSIPVKVEAKPIISAPKIEPKEDIKKKKAAKISGIDASINALNQQVDLLGKTAEAQELYKLKSLGATDAQLELARSSMGVISAFKEQSEAQKQSIKDQENINAQALQIQESMRSEEQVIQESYERRKEIILNSTALAGEAQTSLLLGIENQRNEQLNEINAGFWENYLLSAQENLTSFDELSASTIENLSTGVGAALERMVFDSESFSDSMKNLMEGVARSTVGALGKMAAEWLAYKIVQKALGKSTQASAVGTMTANAKAMAVTSGINAFASTAAIPIIGPALAPGAMAAALSVTTPAAVAVGATAAAGLASFDGGGFTGSGSRSGGMDGKGGFIAMLHPNETVIDHTKNNNVTTMQPRKVEITFNGSRSDVVTIGDVAELFNERINDVGVAIAINDSINNAKRTGDIDDE